MTPAIALGRLVPHLRKDGWAVTGSVAIRARHVERAATADLDLVATSVDVVLPSAGDAYLVSHYHREQPRVPKWMVQLVDPGTRVRIDIFPDRAGALARATSVDIAGRTVKVLTLENILDHKLQTLSKASSEKPVDPKHAEDVCALAAILGRAIPSFATETLKPDVYGLDEDACERCALSRHASFPMASKNEIRRLLGWQ